MHFLRVIPVYAPHLLIKEVFAEDNILHEDLTFETTTDERKMATMATKLLRLFSLIIQPVQARQHAY